MKFLFLPIYVLCGGLKTEQGCEGLCFSEKDLFGARGIILKQPPSPDILPFTKKYFAPSIKQAIRADSLLLHNLVVKNKAVFAQNRSNFYKFDRQYIGFVKQDGVRIILIHMIEPKAVKNFVVDYDKNLMCDIVVVFCSDCKVDIRNYAVDIDKNEVIKF